MSDLAKRLESLQGDIVTVVRQYVEKATSDTKGRVDAMEKIVADLPALLKAEKGERGDKGQDGKDGASVSVDDVRPLVLETVEAAVKALPPPADPIKGDKGDDGKDADPAVVRGMVADEVKQAVAALPVPKDGKDCDMVAVQIIVEAAVKAAFASLPKIEDGEDGRDGRDALEVEILSVIHPTKQYPRGTWARHAGGLVRAFRDTDPVGEKGLQETGWDVMVNGLAGFEVDPTTDDRTLRLNTVMTDGTKALAEVHLSTPHDEGVYEPGRTYAKNDGVSKNGCWWIAQTETTDQPGTSKAWRLAVKCGRDGKDLRAEGPTTREPVRMR
jgi:hypothetical protein